LAIASHFLYQFLADFPLLQSALVGPVFGWLNTQFGLDFCTSDFGGVGDFEA
jgi:hypothetical protein